MVCWEVCRSHPKSRTCSKTLCNKCLYSSPPSRRGTLTRRGLRNLLAQERPAYTSVASSRIMVRHGLTTMVGSATLICSAHVEVTDDRGVVDQARPG